MVRPKEEMLNKRVEDLSLRGDTFLKEIEKLQADSKRREHDTTDMINSLETDVKNRDVDNKSLARKLKELTLQQVADKRGMKSHFDVTLEEAEAVFLAKESKLLNANRQLMQEVSDLTEFKKMRLLLGHELKNTQGTIEDNEQKHLEQLKELERKFYEARARLEKEADDRIAQSRQLYKEEVGKELDMDSKRIRRANKLMEAELTFQRDTSQRLVKENTKYREQAKKLRVELTAKSANDEAKALQGLKNSKNVTELRERLQTLGDMIQTIQADAVGERTQVGEQHLKYVGVLEKKTNNIRQTGKIRTRELVAIKQHASAILSERNEIEKYFLEALILTKDEVQQRRERSYHEACDLYKHFIKDMAHPSSISQDIPDFTSLGPAPRPPKRTVTLDELDAADKNRVLELLLERILTNPRACERMGPPFSEFVRPQANSNIYDGGNTGGGYHGGGLESGNTSAGTLMNSTTQSLGPAPPSEYGGLYLTHNGSHPSSAGGNSEQFFLTEGV